jgi:hypothetical protein
MGAYEPAGFPNQGLSNVPGKRTFQLEVTYGSGDPASAWGKDLAVANTATGKITVTFPRTYRKLTGFRWGWKKAAAGAVLTPVVVTNSIDTASSTGGGTLVIETRASAGTATDPSNGDVLALEFDVSLDALCDEYAITVS